MKQTLTIEQMQHLQELGLDTSNAYLAWVMNPEDEAPVMAFNRNRIWFEGDRLVPAYTLADIIEMLPKQIEDRDGYQSYIVIYHDGKMWVVSYSSEDEEYSEMGYQYHYESGIELIDAAYEMLCWCLENKYIETKEK